MRGKRLAACALALCVSAISQSLAVSAQEALPSTWYAGDYGKVPGVKDQGSYGTCWAVTATLALESALLPQHTMVFSADHIVYKNAFVTDADDGGDYLMLMAYLCGWQGPVTEAEDPYGDGVSPDGLSPAVHVQEVQILLDSPIEKIKEKIFTYGSVQTSLYMDADTAEDGEGYYNAQTAAYYYPEKEVQDHDILILGWDDSYPAENFAQQPEEDGAFICMNTWGREFGEDGIFYVSYEDANIGSIGIVYARVEGTDNYGRLYQNDPCGWQGQQGYGSGTCWFSNVYTAETEEEIKAVGFYATDEDVSYDIYLVHDFAGKASFEDMEYLQSGTLPEKGYYTIDLSEGQKLAAGETFAVAVKVNAPEETSPVAVEYRADSFTQEVTTEGKESYLSRDGISWENTQEVYETNVCLKVYTDAE